MPDQPRSCGRQGHISAQGRISVQRCVKCCVQGCMS